MMFGGADVRQYIQSPAILLQITGATKAVKTGPGWYMP